MMSSRRSLLKLGLAGVLLPTAASAFGSVVRAAPAETPAFRTWRTEFEASLPDRMKAARIAGVSMAILSRDTGTLYTGAFGYADIADRRPLTVETPMHLASVSKLFTAATLVQLFERKGLSLTTDVNELIDFPVRNPHYPKVPITPFQLITHTSSISDEGHGDISYAGDPKLGLSAFLRGYLLKGGDGYSAGSFQDASPGTTWDYCNVAVALAGYVIECVSGQPFDVAVRTALLDPLGLRSAHWYLKDYAPDALATPYTVEDGTTVALPLQGYPDVPAGMLRCSVTDLAVALRAMIGGTPSVLSPQTVAAMLHRQIDPAVYPYQGLGWTDEETATQKVVGHTGSDVGALNMVALNSTQTHAVAVLMNVEGTPAISRFRFSVVDDLLAGAALTG